MTNSEIKTQLLTTIENSQDEQFLNWLAESVELYQSTNSEVLIIPESVQKSIQIGLAQMRAGQTISAEESDEQVAKWLEEK